MSTPAAMATHDASSPRGFYSAEADEDRVWSRERPELEKPPGRFRAADLAGKIPRPESRCASGTVWSHARASCVSAAGIGAGSSSNGSGGFDFWAHFPAVLSLLLAFAVCVVVVVASLLGAFALARFGSRILARGARGTKKIATRLEEEMAKKAKEEKDPHQGAARTGRGHRRGGARRMRRDPRVCVRVDPLAARRDVRASRVANRIFTDSQERPR